MFFPSVTTETQKLTGQEQFKQQLQEEGGATFGEVVEASFSLGRPESLGGKLSQLAKLSDAKKADATMISADEANKQVPDIDIPFSDDVTQGEVTYHRQRLDLAAKNNSIISQIQIIGVIYSIGTHICDTTSS